MKKSGSKNKSKSRGATPAERLDEILLRLGHISEEDVQQALLRQKAHGGRIGSQLLYLKSVTLEQLTQALSVKHNVPGFHPDEHRISEAVVVQVPVELAEDHMILPLNIDRGSGKLSLAVADPGNRRVLSTVRRLCGASSVQEYVAPEALLRILIARHYRGVEESHKIAQIIELPDLFEGGVAVAPELSDETFQEHDAKAGQKTVLMITKTTSLPTFLTPIFEREGFDLVARTDPAEIRTILQKGAIDHVLVSEDSLEDFARLRRDDSASRPVGVSAFSTVSSALLENPVPYRQIARSLFRALQVIAEARCRNAPWKPPYPLICADIQKLGGVFGLRRLVVDGLQIATYVLVPAAGKSGKTGAVNIAFSSFEPSIEFARSLRFPWPVERVLRVFARLLTTRKIPKPSETLDEETLLAGQILALVWYHRSALREVQGSAEEVARITRTVLREQAGQMADLEVVEGYLRLLEHKDDPAGGDRHVFIVSASDELSIEFTAHLHRSGFRTVDVRDLREAQRLCERQAPAAILIDRNSFPDDILKVSQIMALDSSVLVYALTRDNEPSLTLDLLDAGFDDVFSAPYDVEVIVARILKSLKDRTDDAGPTGTPGGFKATFEALPLIDLLQTIGQSQRTVRIHLVRNASENADIYLRKGRMVHAVCGEAWGAEAVYRAITWGDEGEFSVEPTEAIPPDNISESNEAILMEGCRLLDESRV